jgi:hypothetical protein
MLAHRLASAQLGVRVAVAVVVGVRVAVRVAALLGQPLSAVFTIVTSSSMVTWRLPSRSPGQVPLAGQRLRAKGMAVMISSIRTWPSPLRSPGQSAARPMPGANANTIPNQTNTPLTPRPNCTLDPVSRFCAMTQCALAGLLLRHRSRESVER